MSCEPQNILKIQTKAMNFYLNFCIQLNTAFLLLNFHTLLIYSRYTEYRVRCRYFTVQYTKM